MRGRQKQRRGLTLAELIISLAMLALGVTVLAQGFVNLRSSRVSVKAEAEQLAELMRTLRQQAITENRPYGLGLPTQGGSVAASNGYYVLEGEHHPRITRRVLMARDRAVQVSGCYWPELGFGAPPTTTFSNSSYALSGWQAPNPADGMLMFLPSGEVLTNLPTVQGEAAVVLGYAIEGSVSNVGGQPAMQLQRVKGPEVVWCSLFGEVRLEGGLSGAPGRVSDTVAASASAPVPAVTGSSNSSPTFVMQAGKTSLLDASPPPNANTLASVAGGSSGTLRVARYISLKVTARDPDGDPLYCSWDAGGQGTLTKGDDVRMVYDPKIDMWVSTFAWHQPQASGPGDSYTLKATISDHRGGQAALAGLISGGGNFKILKLGRIAFQRGPDIWMSNWDGSDPVIVAKGFSKPRWNHDGSAIVCTGPPPNNALTLVTPDGRKQIQLYVPPAGLWTSPGSFNMEDNRIVLASQGPGGGVSVGEISPWGGGGLTDWGVSGILAADFPPGSNPIVDCSPLISDIAIVSSSGPSGGAIYKIDRSSGSAVATKQALAGFDASFCPNGDIIFRSGAGQISRGTLGGTVSITASLGGAVFPRLAGSSGSCVVGGDDGGKRNVYVYVDGVNLSSPLKLFSFPESCTDPDWAD
ncbi:MAG: type II secretion system protein [Vulcanimicrobiota bacterium]